MVKQSLSIISVSDGYDTQDSRRQEMWSSRVTDVRRNCRGLMCCWQLLVKRSAETEADGARSFVHAAANADTWGGGRHNVDDAD